MAISQYFNEFVIFSFIGWVYESIYCTLKDKRWQNRGFLFGPVCPIYGFGATGAIILFGRILPYLTKGMGEPPLYQIFLICMVGTAVIEYTTSYILEKAFHAVWWDYSHVPMNINGRICLPASLAFGAAGIVIVKFVFPIVYQLEDRSVPILTELLSLILMAALTADTVLSVSSLTDLLAKVENGENEFNEKMEVATEKLLKSLSHRQKEIMLNVTFRFEKPNRAAQYVKDRLKEIGMIGNRKKEEEDTKNEGL